jgi:ABC-2 type transport system permease protein
MQTQRIFGVTLRIYYLMRSSFTRVFPLFAWAAIDIVLWGFITKYLNVVTKASFDFVPTLLGAVLLWDFFTRAMFGVSTSFFEDVWSRNFLNLFSTPLTVAEYLMGLVVSSVITSAFGLTIMLIIASLAFHLSLLSYGVWFLPFVLVLFLFGIALGIIAIGIILRFGPSAEWFIWPLPAILAPVAAVFYPVSVLPSIIQPIARIMPASYVFEGMRALVAGHSVPQGTLLIGAGLAVIDVLLACWFFRTMFLRAVRTGLIARYSAESMT